MTGNAPRVPVWLLEASADQVEPGDDWLTPREASRLAALRVDKRAREWRLGRWTAKAAIAWRMGVEGTVIDPGDVEIVAAPDGAPEAFVAGAPAPFALSISHGHGRALAALAPAGVALGCDLERVEPRAEAFVRDVFTDAERQAIDAAGADRDLVVTALWSAKESVLKALRMGLRADTRWVEASVDPSGQDDGWRPIGARHLPDGSHFRGWWATRDGSVLALACDPSPDRPRELRLGEATGRRDPLAGTLP